MVVWYSWKESISIPVCTLLLPPWYPLWHLPDLSVQVTGGFLLTLQSIQGIRAGERVRPVLGERDRTAGMSLLAEVSWACRAELHPTALPFAPSCFFLSPFAPGTGFLVFPSLLSSGLLLWVTLGLVCLEPS